VTFLIYLLIQVMFYSYNVTKLKGKVVSEDCVTVFII